jgi:tetratricopeptide (TPR) repeat protein
MGQAEAGLDELRAQAIAHPQDHQLWLSIGLECEGLGRADEAEENLRRGARLASAPDDKTEAYLLLFDFYRSQGRVEDALAAWGQAWESQRKEPEYIFPLYQMMWENGDLERAHRYLDQEKNPLRKGFHEGLFAQSDGKPEEAARHWKRVARMDPTEFEEGQEAWAEAALRAEHRPEEVIAHLGSLLESDQFSPRSLLLQVIAEARVGHIDHLERVLELARHIRLQGRPRQEKLAASDWALFDELVENIETKDKVRHWFETDAPGEGESLSL